MAEMNVKNFDLLVIGGGSGGLAVAKAAASHGKNVALVESRELGGTCVNNGCVPKKVMWYAANIAHAVRDAAGFGIQAGEPTTRWGDLVAARDNYIGNINRAWMSTLAKSGIEYLRGHARFVDPRTVAIDGALVRAERFVISTGGRPIVPKVPGANLGITSDEFFELKAQPRKAAVIGGGYIGVELSGLLKSLGTHVTLCTLEDRVLEAFDPAVSEAVEEHLVGQGVRVYKQFQVSSLRADKGGVSVLGSTKQRLEGFDTVIWAVGRRPNTENLHLEAAGVRQSRGGVIAVDEYLQTNVSGIYAIGDVTGNTALTPVAIAAGRRLAENLYAGNSPRPMEYQTVPSVVFAHPPVGTVGLTEPEACRKFPGEVIVYETRFTPMRYALSHARTATTMKLVCAGPDRNVVGVHIVGDGADEILQGFAVAVRMGIRKSDLDDTIAIHPTSAEELVTMRLPGRHSQCDSAGASLPRAA
jgi:glutathione reductase (NADPH)